MFATSEVTYVITHLLARSFLLFPSQATPSQPIFARGINNSEIEICTGFNRNSRDRTFAGVKFTAKARQRILASVAQVAIESK